MAASECRNCGKQANTWACQHCGGRMVTTETPGAD